MALTKEETAEVRKVVGDSLDRAERIWGEVGVNFSGSERRHIVLANEAVDSKIPGHPAVQEQIAEVDDFVALVADMRDSSKHLMTRIGSAKVSELQRVFYETSALIPALAMAIRFGGGSVTEYLGDGVLALFQAGGAKKTGAIYSAHSAATNCLEVVSEAINPLIAKRYSLPPIVIGVGMSFSKAIVTVVGDDSHREAKVFGECVYYASKLSGGCNQIYIDEALKFAWPESDNGVLRFLRKKVREVDGYLISENS